jgi:hypothetical protein
MFRPLILIGAFLIGIALISFLLIPGYRGSPLGIAVLVFCLGVGGFAIVKDMRDLWGEVKKLKNNNEKTGGDGDDNPEV